MVDIARKGWVALALAATVAWLAGCETTTGQAYTGPRQSEDQVAVLSTGLHAADVRFFVMTVDGKAVDALQVDRVEILPGTRRVTGAADYTPGRGSAGAIREQMGLEPGYVRQPGSDRRPFELSFEAERGHSYRLSGGWVGKRLEAWVVEEKSGQVVGATIPLDKVPSP